MPRIELPSTAWIEYRDKLKAEDKFAAQGSFTTEVDSGGKQLMPSGIGNLITRALMGRIITSWGGPGLDGILIPAQSPAGDGIITSTLDLDDYNAFAEAVQPLVDKVLNSRPNPAPAATTPSSS